MNARKVNGATCTLRSLAISGLALGAAAHASCAGSPYRNKAPFAFTHVTVIDMTGAGPREDMTVVVRGNRIEALGPSDSVRVPEGTLVLNAAGKFLIPGLWDMHVHAAWPETLPTFGPLFVAHGVTGVREMFGQLDLVAGARIRLAQHRLTEPRMVASGAILNGDPAYLAPMSVALTSTGQASHVVDSLHAAGADFIKVVSLLSPDIFRAVIAAANRVNLDVVGHVPHELGSLEASRAGLKSNEHMLDILLSCSTDETALRADLIGAIKEHPRDSTFFVEWRQARPLLDSYSEQKCESLAARLARDSMCQVPTSR